MNTTEHNVVAFLAAEEAHDILREALKTDRRSLRRARRLVRRYPYNIVGSARLLRWAADRYEARHAAE